MAYLNSNFNISQFGYPEDYFTNPEFQVPTNTPFSGLQTQFPEGFMQNFSYVSPDQGMFPNLSAPNLGSISDFSNQQYANELGKRMSNGDFWGTPKAPGMDWMDIGKFGLNGINTALTGYLGLKSLGLAKKQFNLASTLGNANLNNSIKDYNNTLERRAKLGASMSGRSDEDTQKYIDEHKLTR